MTSTNSFSTYTSQIQPLYITEKQAADRCNLSVSYLKKLRYKEEGPRSYKFGRRIRYLIDDVDTWLDSRIFPAIHKPQKVKTFNPKRRIVLNRTKRLS